MKNIKQLIVKFQNEINFAEISMFRGAVNALVGQERSVLFHNHIDKGFRYSYPLIQYKRINKKAAIVCIDEGTEAIGEFFNSDLKIITLGNKSIDFVLEEITADSFLVQTWQSDFKYKLRNWIPFNSENYKSYLGIDGLSDRICLMERVLTGNILSFLKGIGIFVEDKVKCKITSIENQRIIHYKGVRLMSFDINFSSNVSLPDSIGLGKGVSIGYGVISRKKDKSNSTNG